MSAGGSGSSAARDHQSSIAISVGGGEMANLRGGGGRKDAGLAGLHMKVEAIVIGVADVERAKDFYTKLGWRQDVTPPGVFQFTPHGSACSVQFGQNLTSAAPGSAQRTYLVVSDIVAARDALSAAGVEVGEIFHIGP